MAPGPAESKAVVLVTDGVDTASLATFDELRELARRSEVPVFSIGIGGGDGVPQRLPPSWARRPGGGGVGRAGLARGRRRRAAAGRGGAAGAAAGRAAARGRRRRPAAGALRSAAASRSSTRGRCSTSPTTRADGPRS